jgi:copper chaperone
MKDFAVVVTVVIACASLYGCGQGTAQTETATIEVSTLRCDECVQRVKSAVGKMEGVKNVEVDLDAKQATVEFEPGRVQLASIEQTIAKTGFDANECRRDTAAHASLPSCCQ